MYQVVLKNTIQNFLIDILIVLFQIAPEFKMAIPNQPLQNILF